MIARWTAQEGSAAEVRSKIQALIEPSRSEPGNLMYNVHEDPEDARVFVFYEQYADAAAYAAHGASQHFRALAVEGAIPLLASRERWFLRTLEDDR